MDSEKKIHFKWKKFIYGLIIFFGNSLIVFRPYYYAKYIYVFDIFKVNVPVSNRCTY